MKQYLLSQLTAAFARLGLPTDIVPGFETPRQKEHGDVTTTVALALAKRLHRNPRDLARQIVDTLEVDPRLVRRVECAGAGFINFSFTELFYQEQLKGILGTGGTFGRSSVGAGRRVQVEFVSANPTGPLTVGHGRGAVFGDSIARLMEWTGHVVEREYYFNNAGRQMRILGDSVRLRYLELLGDQVTFPEEYYQGEYIKDIARHLVEEHGGDLRNVPATGIFKERAEEEIFGDIKRTLGCLGIEFTTFFNENSLYESGKIDLVVRDLRERGLVYEQDGAVWLKTSQLGGEKDKVIIKNTGEPTYRLPDIAYHREKYARGFDLMIDVFGADHVATYPDVLAALKALDYDVAKTKVLIHQFVTILQQGEVVKMSTRKANFITLDELIEDVGADVVRWFFLMRTVTSHLNFDLDLARKQSIDNPVYYVQYAHARISSIFSKAKSLEKEEDPHSFDFSLLSTPAELDLMKSLLQLPDAVEMCAATFEPHRLTEYLYDLAGVFHRFYHVCDVLTEDKALTQARLALCRATKIVLQNGLTMLGISAPDAMHRISSEEAME
ncbi:MAG: arginine--tRNA ligase [Bacteroidota bacterium]